MPSQQIAFDAGLLRRYDRPGPRYTSYPTAPQFSADFGEAALREVARASNEDPIPRPLSLYVHVPFCFSPCFYCGCNRIITRDLARGPPTWTGWATRSPWWRRCSTAIAR
jgi:oxygen-independent coproporphyrinogen-3 oxidase